MPVISSTLTTSTPITGNIPIVTPSILFGSPGRNYNTTTNQNPSLLILKTKFETSLWWFPRLALTERRRGPPQVLSTAPAGRWAVPPRPLGRKPAETSSPRSETARTSCTRPEVSWMSFLWSQNSKYSFFFPLNLRLLSFNQRL